jgi:hypothetical protein
MRHRASLAALSLVALMASGTAPSQSIEDVGNAKPPVIHEKKDASGRLLRQVVFNADGTIHHLAIIYGPRASKITINVALDAVRDPVAETRETLDEDGRIVEREDMTVTDGVQVKTRTKYNYDPAGRQTTTIEVLK